MQSEMDKITIEVLVRFGNLTEEADKRGKRVENAREHLGAAQVTNTELEVELRRVKIQ